jgi:hypothetical protein
MFDPFHRGREFVGMVFLTSAELVLTCIFGL